MDHGSTAKDGQGTTATARTAGGVAFGTGTEAPVDVAVSGAVITKISFCTTCGNRLVDLRHTLPRNLKLLEEREEIVLLDYNSRDGLREWVLTNFARDLGAGRLRLYSDRKAPRFFMSHAKNVAHLLGRGRVLVNLDSDNFLSPEYLQLVRASDFDRSGMFYPHNGRGGHKGRTAIRADLFRTMGGYDEAMNLGYGMEEIDLVKRIWATNRRADGYFVDPGSVIPTPPAMKEAGNAKGLTFQQSNNAHKKMSEANIAAGRLVANAGRRWGAATLYDATEGEHHVGYPTAD